MADSEEIIDYGDMETTAQKDVNTSCSESQGLVEQGHSSESVSQDAGDDSNIRKICVTVKTPQEKKVIRVSAAANLKELKEVAARDFDVSSDRLCLIFSGKVLQDEDQLAAHGIEDGSTLHCVIKSALPQTDQQQNPAADEAAGEKPAYGPMQFAHIGMEPLNYAQLQQHMQRQMLSNPDMIREMVQNPLVQQLMANPSVITELISSNPQTKDWLKRNPELAELLNNKEIMQQTLEISQNPEMLSELIAAQGKGKTQLQSGTGTAAGSKYGATTSLPELQTMWHHLAQKPQVLQQMFNAPYMKPFLEGLSANPQVAQQMMANQQLFANNPALQQQMQYMMPYYLQQLQNPLTRTMMTNSKAMQAMIKIQHGLDMLHAEAPGLIGSFGLPYLSQPPNLATFAPAEAASNAASDDAATSADAVSSLLSQMIAQIANGQINQPPEERFKHQLDQLTSMGFTDQQNNLQVLVGTFGDLGAAVEQLNRQQS